MSSSLPTSGTANAMPPTPATQSPQGTVGAQPQPPNPATSATLPVASSVPNAGHQVTPIVAQEVQAAQLEHTLGSPTDPKVVHGSNEPSNCALAGGASAPQSPLAGSAPPPAKKRRRQRHDNHVSVRFSDDENDVITRRMERTGEKQSDAVRAMIEIFAQGIVTDVHFAQGILTVTLNVGNPRRKTPASLACRVTGKLAARLRRRIKPGEEITVRGLPRSLVAEIAADSFMNSNALQQGSAAPAQKKAKK